MFGQNIYFFREVPAIFGYSCDIFSLKFQTEVFNPPPSLQKATALTTRATPETGILNDQIISLFILQYDVNIALLKLSRSDSIKKDHYCCHVIKLKPESFITGPKSNFTQRMVKIFVLLTSDQPTQAMYKF